MIMNINLNQRNLFFTGPAHSLILIHQTSRLVKDRGRRSSGIRWMSRKLCRNQSDNRNTHRAPTAAARLTGGRGSCHSAALPQKSWRSEEVGHEWKHLDACVGGALQVCGSRFLVQIELDLDYRCQESLPKSVVLQHCLAAVITHGFINDMTTDSSLNLNSKRLTSTCVYCKELTRHATSFKGLCDHPSHNMDQLIDMDWM